jgi:hypothetical protein
VIDRTPGSTSDRTDAPIDLEIPEQDLIEGFKKKIKDLHIMQREFQRKVGTNEIEGVGDLTNEETKLH